MNLKEIQNKIIERLNLNIDNIEPIKERGLSFVYIFNSDNKKYILKIYRKKLDFNNTYNLINYLKLNNIKTINTIYNFDENDFNYVIYEFIDGKHLNNYDESQVDKIVNLLQVLYSNNISGDNNILNKCDEYFNYLLSLGESFVNNEIVLLLYDMYKRMKFNIDDFNLVHGDLSNSNFIWNDDINIIDFDESILAPREYEITSCIIKTCFENGIFNKDQAKNIFNSLKSKININYESFRNSWNLYIIKVIIEKYYYESLSHNNDINKVLGNDHWSYWFNLLFNEEIISDLFEYNKEKNTAGDSKPKIISNTYKGKVSIVSVDKKQYIDKHEYLADLPFSKNEYNLVNMIYNFGLNDLEFYNLNCFNDEIIKRFSYIDGIIKNDLSDTDLINITNKIYNIYSFLIKYGNIYLKNEIGDIVEKMNWCKEILTGTEYYSIICDLLNDKEFLSSLDNEEKIIIHDDLHRNNIIFNGDKIVILDFYGLKKYPKSMQLASLIMNLLILYDDYRFKIILDNWKEKVDFNKLKKLIIFRMLKGLAFYYKYLKEYNNEEYDTNAKNLKKNIDYMLRYKQEDI